MKQYTKKSLALFIVASLLVGCQNQNPNSVTSDSNSTTSQTQSSQSISTSLDVPVGVSNELLNELLQANNNDQEAKDIWIKILQQTVDFHHGKVETSGEISLYDYKGDDISSNTPNNFLEEIERKTGMIIRNNDILAMSDMESDEENTSNLINLYGKYAKVAPNYSIAVKALLNQEKSLSDEGQITDINEDTYTKDTYAPIFLQENLMNGGYLRSVDPMNHASLYVYECNETAEGFQLTATIQSVSDFQAKAKRTRVSEDENKTQTLIALDEVTKEQFVFEFDSNGILEEVTNDIFRVRIDKEGKKYVNLHNEIEIENFDVEDDFTQELDLLMQMIESRKLESGSSFDVPQWD